MIDIETLAVAAVGLSGVAIGILGTIWRRYTPSELDKIVMATQAAYADGCLTPDEVLTIVNTALNGYLQE